MPDYHVIQAYQPFEEISVDYMTNLTVRYGASKFDYKWKGPYRVIKNTDANIYQCADLRRGKVVELDVSVMRAFKCPPGVDPLAVDESEYPVDAILSHRLEGSNKRNKTHYYFLVRFKDGEEEWSPYLEVRELEAFDIYLRNHQEFARKLKLKVSSGGG